MEGSVVERHGHLLNPVEIGSNKLNGNTVVVTEAQEPTELIETQYINLHRIPENLEKVHLVGDDLLSQQVVELSGNDFVTAPVGSGGYYEDELLAQDLTEEDKRLAAALVAVQLVHQQKQQHSVLTSELLKNVSLDKPVTAMVASYFQGFDDDASSSSTQQHQGSLIDAESEERMLKIYQSQPATTTTTTTTSLPEIRLPLSALPPLKKGLSNQSLLRDRYDRSLLDQVPTEHNTKDHQSRSQERKGDKPQVDIDPLDCEEADSDFECESGLKSSKRSLPHKKRIPRKLKTQPSRNLHSKGTIQVPPKRTNSFSCEICGFQNSNQVKFFEHLKGHYEPNVLQVSNGAIQQSGLIEYSANTSVEPLQGDFSLKNEQPEQGGRLFRRQNTHVDSTHSQIEEFSEPEDMMEGIRHVVNIQAGTADDEGEDKLKTWRYPTGLNITTEVCVEDSKPEMDTERDLNSLADCLSENEKAGNKKRKKTVQCPHCSRTFTHRNSLLYHVRSHSGRRPHQCDVCGKGFFAANALRVHMRTHSGDKPYTCEVCSRNFRQWGDLKYHMTSLHSDTKQYQCEFCGKDFARKYSLIVHRRIHTGEKDYVCEYCKKEFRASSYLVNHRRIHTGEKPYKCDVCLKPFRVKSDMKRHRNTHNKERNNDQQRQAQNDRAKTERDAEVLVTEGDTETILNDTSLPLNLNMRQDSQDITYTRQESNDGITYTRDPLDRDSNTVYVWIPTGGESILPD